MCVCVQIVGLSEPEFIIFLLEELPAAVFYVFNIQAETDEGPSLSEEGGEEDDFLDGHATMDIMSFTPDLGHDFGYQFNSLERLKTMV